MVSTVGQDYVTLTVLRGLPASGKTTWALNEVTANPNAVRVCKDDLRVMLKGKAYTRRDEDVISTSEYLLVETLLRSGRDVILDDVNLSTDYKWLELAQLTNGKYVLKQFDCDVATAIQRDARRTDKESVGSSKIREMVARMINLNG